MANFFRSVWRKLFVAATVAVGSAALAGVVVVTPGSLASHTYFPKSPTVGGGGGSGDGENVSTLQRCLYSPSAGDVTITVSNSLFDYDKPITLYYRLAGGNGGSGFNGGGGGSSAIVLNGSPAAVGPGANGGSVSSEVSGFLKFKKGDTLRFITGGAGGDGYAAGPAIGGGGGAGYAGGGAGASRATGAIVASEAASSVGKGGGTSPGQGGTVSGGFAGTPGIGINGGVSTWPNGNSLPSSTGSYNSWQYYDFAGVSFVQERVRFPATATEMGSPNGKMTPGYAYFAGGGGMLGHGGQPAVTLRPNYCSGSNASTSVSSVGVVVDDNGTCNTYYNRYLYHRSRVGAYTPHSAAMKLTRGYPEVINNGYQPINTYGGAIGGQIITMYQAPTCDLLQ